MKIFVNFCPMSKEIIEVVYKYSHEKKVKLGLTASMNQININSGYVCNSKDYETIRKQMMITYPQSNVSISRDHCGPGFSNNFLECLFKDLEYGFDLIHIDVCNVPKNQQLKMINNLGKIIPRIEVGSDKITDPPTHPKDMENFIKNLTFLPEYFVVNTGSRVMEDKQVGSFYKRLVGECQNIAHNYQIKTKEHNADFLRNLDERIGYIDSINIGPELGITQTQCLIHLALKKNIDISPFLNEAYESKQWKKWQLPGTTNKKVLACISGHYVYNQDQYKKLKEKLGIELEEYIRNTLERVINKYVNN